MYFVSPLRVVVACLDCTGVSRQRTASRVPGEIHNKNGTGDGDVRKANFRNEKTTRRWFHDTAYCFDYSTLSQWYPEWDLNPHSANAEGF